ncbi:MAG TPA: VOC family protein, partial [Myxococcales bacterium]|nr:VOC family protein [Myxococcales bacterium]
AGHNTQSLMVYVDDVKAHCEQARAAGARITDEPSTHDYGEEYWADLSYGCEDVGGHLWWFTQRLRGE